MDRKTFLTTIGLSAPALLATPNRIIDSDKPEAYQKEVVSSFVGAGHSNLDKVKELLTEFPNLIYSSWDWGGGDFETAIGAAGHVGNKPIAHFLLDRGARPTLHCLAMLGKTELVKPTLEAYPKLLKSLGPHGFTFLHHAQRGGDEATDLLEYFEMKGLKKTKVDLYAD
ncbi:MAG: ankyrin repeat domain-containing protein [Chloroflexota bacterium]|nr:ankyrin repeat domain-containing protein [Chloroflexota bacterium]